MSDDTPGRQQRALNVRIEELLKYQGKRDRSLCRARVRRGEWRLMSSDQDRTQPAHVAELIANAGAALARPPALAEGLPGIFYGSEFYEIERKTLFPSSWCPVTVASVIPEPGDMVPIDLAGWPILILRTQDRSIRAFHNICRHRAIKLVNEPRHGANVVRCPWHSWAYALDGRLVAMPEVGGAGLHSAEGFDKPELGLKPIPVGRWLDYVFVNIDGAARPFEEHIAPLDALLKGFDLGTLCHGGSLDETYSGNWKLSVESGIEDYHLPFGHPQMNAHLSRNFTLHAADGVFAGGSVIIPAVTDTAPLEPTAGPERLPRLRMRGASVWPGNFVLNIFPTGTMLITPDHVMLGTLMPAGPATTKVELHLYFDGDAATSAACQEARDQWAGRWRRVMPQDFPFIEGTQATILARDAAGIRTRFSPYWEQAVLSFQRSVLNALT